MKIKEDGGFRSRPALISAVVGLMLTSVIFGYASRVLRAEPAAEASPAVQTSRLDADEAAASGSAPVKPASRVADRLQDPLTGYRTTLALLKKNYYGAAIDARKSQHLTYEAIRGMLSSLRDQFTSFLDPDDWNQMKATTEGDFEGIGALLEQDGTAVKVVRPIETSPAAASGILADDVLISIDRVSVKGQPLNEVVRRIKGKVGTKVRIGVQRGQATLEFVLVRSIVEPPVVEHGMDDPENKIGRIVLSEFNEKSLVQMQKAYADLDAQGMRGLVFDLRNNPGGLLETAEDVASLFIPRDETPELNNVVVYIHEGTGKDKGIKLRAPDFPVKPMPMVVLVNGNSASASEIVSGAIKDYGVATLIGERTYGKGRVQTLYPLDDGSALRLTTALYFPPRHYDINFERDAEGAKIENTGGIEPDIEVKQPSSWRPENVKDKRNDVQLQSALRFLRARLDGKTLAEARQQGQTVR